MERVDKFIKKSLHMKSDNAAGFFKLAREAEKAEWVVVYKDENAVIYQDIVREKGR